MGFIAPFLPGIIKAGVGIGSSLLGSKLSHVNPTGAEQNVLNQNAEAQRLGLDQARQLFPQAQSLISRGMQAQQPVLNYWSSLLSGNRGLMTSALAPEISRIGQGYNAASQASAALMPRGGPSATFLSELPFQQQHDVSTLMQQARPQAASGLLQAGQGIAGQGGNLLQSGVSALYGSTAAGRDILQQAQNARLLEAERGKSIGSGIFDFVNKFGLDQLFKKGGGGGSIWQGGYSAPFEGPTR